MDDDAARLGEALPGPRYRDLNLLAGQLLQSVSRRGKFLVVPLTRNGERVNALIIHLGMTGVLSLVPPPRPQHLRVLLGLDGGLGLHFTDARRFGRFLLTPAGDHSSLPPLQAMGPEPLGEGFTAEAFAAARARSVTAVKTYLLSQRPVAGVGNIYADEARWRAGVNPATPARDVPAAQIGPLRDAIRAVLAESIAREGTTFSDYRTVTGATGSFQDSLAVYGRAEQPCGRCGHPIRRTVLGGRGTHHCPHCQPSL